MAHSTSTIVLFAFLLSGCVSHQWTRGSTATMPFTQASGNRKLVAMGAERGSFAVGSPSFVAGASIGAGLGNAIRVNSAYNACMEAAGFIATDTQSGQAQIDAGNDELRPEAIAGGCKPGQPCACGGGPNIPTTCRPN